MSSRFFVDPAAIQRDEKGFVAEITGEEAHHALRVLRIAPGDAVVVLDDSGLEYRGRVRKIDAQGKSPRFWVHGDKISPAAGEPPFRLQLVQALPKGDKMDLVVQKGTEVGVTRFAPALSERVVVEYNRQKAEARRARWQRIAKESAKQAGRGKCPYVAEIRPIDECLADRKDEPVLILWERATTPIKAVLAELGPKRPSGITLVIGPEGGLSEREVCAMEALGGLCVSIGPRILRTETAGLIAAAMILYEWEMSGA